MKKCLFFLLSALILASCGSNQPVETSIQKNDVDITGNAFNSFRLGGDVHLVMTPDPENPSAWGIRATVPLQKADDIQIEEMEAEINLLDANGIKVRENFTLIANDLVSLLPVFNASQNTKKTIVFSVGEGMKKDFTYKEAVALLQSVKKISLTINTKQTEEKSIDEEEVEEEPEPTEENPAPQNRPMTLNTLLTDYGIYGMLAQYERYLKQGDKRRAKEIEDRMYAIEKRVEDDPSIPKSLRERFVDYIEDKEDEIEDRY